MSEEDILNEDNKEKADKNNESLAELNQNYNLTQV